jgi:hypothetical protein
MTLSSILGDALLQRTIAKVLKGVASTTLPHNSVFPMRTRMVSTDTSSPRILYSHMVAQMQETSPSVTPNMVPTSSKNSPASDGWTLVVRKISKTQSLSLQLKPQDV